MTMTPCTAFRGKADVCVKSESYLCLKIYRERDRERETNIYASSVERRWGVVVSLAREEDGDC
jgi:hypothetical protein